MFNYYELCEIISGGDEVMINWCQDVGLVKGERRCDVCDVAAKLCPRKRGNKGSSSLWRCRKLSGEQPHYWQESVFKGTIFEGSRFGIGRVLRLFYLFAHGFTKYSDVVRETSTSDEKTSAATVRQWLTYGRKVCTTWMDRQFDSEDGKIGGPGIIVEISETTIGKRKSDKVGRRPTVDKWVVGMIEIQQETGGDRGKGDQEEEDDEDPNGSMHDGRFRVEVCPDNVRDETTLVGLIKKYVKEGSPIMTDCWHESYGHLEAYGYTRVPFSQRQWQTIDNQLRSLKKSLCRGGITEENLPDHLNEFMWRSEMDRLNKDRFLGFIECTVEVYNLY